MAVDCLGKNKLSRETTNKFSNRALLEPLDASHELQKISPASKEKLKTWKGKLRQQLTLHPP